MAAPMKRLKTIQEDAVKVRAAGVSNLLLELGSGLNKPESSDVVFICKDGEEVYASRWLLSLRNPFFRAMFNSEMLESKSAKIPSVQFPSATILLVFEYLYTGAIRSHPILNWKMGFEIISAGHYFRIPDLEVIAQEFLWEKVSHVNKHLRGNLVIQMLCEALDFQESWKGKDALLAELMGDLCTDWCLEEKDFHMLSENAMDYILSKRRGGGDAAEEQPPSVEEYYAFREIVMWHVYQKLPSLDAETQKKLRKALPIEEDDCALLSTIHENVTNVSFNASVPQDPTAVLNSILGIEIPRESFQRLLTHVDWSRVPAIVLLKVLCPLNAVPVPALFKNLASHVLHKAVEPLPYGPYKWKSSACLTCGLDGQVTCKSKDGSRSVRGRAVSSLPVIMQSNGIYKWQFQFRENDSNFVELGIVGGSKSDAWRAHLLDEDYLWCSPGARVLWMYSRQGISTVGFKKLKSQEFKGCDAFWVKQKEDSLVKFRLNAAERTCHVTFGVFSATLWRDLSDAVYHPVIGINDGKSVSVKLKAISGFDYL